MKNLFITGTDTGVGKTIITGLLAHYLKLNNINVITQKWFQTGANNSSLDIDRHLNLMESNKRELGKYNKQVSPFILLFPQVVQYYLETHGNR